METLRSILCAKVDRLVAGPCFYTMGISILGMNCIPLCSRLFCVFILIISSREERSQPLVMPAKSILEELLGRKVNRQDCTSRDKRQDCIAESLDQNPNTHCDFSRRKGHRDAVEVLIQ